MVSHLLHELQEFPAVLLVLSLSLPALSLPLLFRLSALSLHSLFRRSEVDQMLLLHLHEHLDQHRPGVSRGHDFLCLSVAYSELAAAFVGGCVMTY